MKNKTLLLTSLCLLASYATVKANAPVRDYKMVDLKNGLTTELLEIGKTSLTFSVEWKLGMEFDENTLYLMGKLNVELRGWDFIQALYLDPSQWQDIYPAGFPCFPVTLDTVQRKATFKIPYSHIMWHDDEEEKEYFEKKAFFAVRVPLTTNLPEGNSSKGKYEEDDEQDDDEKKTQGTGMGKANHLWLYTGILIGSLCATFYFLRRKLKIGN